MKRALSVLLALALTSCGEAPTAPAADAAAADSGCASDLACSDGLFCNGAERCMAGVCTPAAAGACVARMCDEARDTCGSACTDADSDGSCAEVDCDDQDLRRYPGAIETCDSVDQDCDPATLGPDGDGDSFPAVACCNAQPAGAPRCGTDCDDNRATVNPSAVESCNGNVDDDCDGRADANDGVCMPCPAGFDGFDGNCVDRDECAMDVCGLGAASCMNTPGSYVCSCNVGYSAPASGGSCADVNECGTMPCGALATACTNTLGSYACTCAPGYMAPPTGGACAEVDECTMGTPCGASVGTCTNASGGYTCACIAGYSAPPRNGTCADIDECAAGAPCGAAGRCTNTLGSYSCACDPGYSAPAMGGSCVDVDECATGGCDTDPLAVCTNTAGGFSCMCPANFTGNGRGATGCQLTDPALAGLTASTGTLTPVFAGATTTYSLVLPGAVSSFTLTPTLAFPTHATVRIEGVVVTSGAASSALALTAFAPRTITIVVTTDSGAMRTYTINVTGRCQARPTGDPAWAQYRLPGTVPRSYSAGAQTVIDCVTGLEWQRAADGTGRTWSASRTYCDNLVLGGFSDWRSPTRFELTTLLNPALAPPKIDLTAFPAAQGGRQWAATAVFMSPGFAMYVDFSNSEVAGAPEANTYITRCVR